MLLQYWQPATSLPGCPWAVGLVQKNVPCGSLMLEVALAKVVLASLCLDLCLDRSFVVLSHRLQ